MNALKLKQWQTRLTEELTQRVIPFWVNNSIDRQFGGYLTCLERDGKPYDGLKQMWMQWREVYMFATLCNSRFKCEEFLALAKHGYDFLVRHGLKTDGTYAYMLNRQGEIIADKADGAEVFTGSFAAIAAAELYRATGAKEYKDEAFLALERYRNAIAAAGNASRMRRLAYPMIQLNVLSLMHRAFGDAIPRQDIDACIKDIFTLYNPEMGIFHENAPASGGFDLDSQDGRFSNPGHALEGLSFILEEFRTRKEEKDPFAEEYLPKALSAIKSTFQFGWDTEQGGIWYYRDVLGKPVSKNEFMLKAWWPQNEAATAVLRAYEATLDDEFLTMFEMVEEFAWQHLRDSEYPEWFAYAAVDGRQVHSYKGSRFKGFFHVPRHLLDCITVCERLETIQ